MKKISIISFLLLIFVVIGCKTGENNSGDDLDTETVSEGYFFPEEIIYNQSVSEVLIDKFYPIGWSKDGNFAYLIEPADEGLGNYMFGIVIINLVSNEVLWDWYTEPLVDKELYREDIWKKQYEEFSQQLNKYGIIQVRNIEIKDRYFTYENVDFVVRAETQTEEDQDINVELVNHCDIYIKSPEMGEKLITSLNYEMSLILVQQISGCLVSPFEDRVVIILKNERWGYEGPPDVVEFEVFGTNLSTGFVE